MAGLLLARGLRRRRDIAIILALGASRGQIVRQLLVESLVLAAAGGAAGLIVAVWATELLRGFFGINYQGGAVNLDLTLDVRIIAAGLAVALATGLATGLAPALQSTRVDTLPALKDESGAATSRRSTLRDGLIVVQVAVSVLLLAASALLVRSFLMVHRGPGFDPEAVVMLRLRPSLLGYGADRSWAFQREVIRRLETLPGVEAVSPATIPPLPRWLGTVEAVHVPGQHPDPQHQFEASTTYVGPRYFKALGAAIVEGREFDDGDRPDGARVAIVNQTLASRFWPAGGAIGNVLMIGGSQVQGRRCRERSAVRQRVGAAQASGISHYWQQDRTQSWAHDSRTYVRVSGDAAAMLPAILRAIAAIDADVPVSEAQPLAVRLDYEFSDVRAVRTLLLTFGVLALGLSAIGLYAALAFAVTERTREIAIRVALGAERRDVGRLILIRGAAIVLLGVAAGLVAAFFAGPLLANLLYGVNSRDPIAMGAGPLVLGLVAGLAIWLPARRAMNMDPVTALRAVVTRVVSNEEIDFDERHAIGELTVN